MAQSTILISPSQRTNPAARLLLSTSRVAVRDVGADGPFDFQCGPRTYVLFEYLSRLAHASHQRHLSQRMSRVARDATVGVVLIRVDLPEPLLDVLSWVNMQTAATRCSLLLCWTDEEVARTLEGLAESSSTSVDVISGRSRCDAPVPLLVDALTQTPHVVNRNDVIRLANQFGSVAQLLQSHPDDLLKLPGFGRRKAARFSAILNATFPGTQQRVEDVLPARAGEQPHGPANDAGGGGVALREALRRVRDREDSASRSDCGEPGDPAVAARPPG